MLSHGIPLRAISPRIVDMYALKCQLSLFKFTVSQMEDLFCVILTATNPTLFREDVYLYIVNGWHVQMR